MSRGYYAPGHPFLYTAPDSGSPALGMDCLQLRSPTAPGPFHYLINEHSKSLVALQELQHEVGALLEFRDLVIETFPNLRTKLASSTPSTMTSHASNIPVAVRREWEPGIRVRRKLQHKDDSSSSFSRSRSNSHSGKQQPKSGDAVSVIQDSGFSTETSSSKETPSASSSAIAASSTSTAPVIEQNEAEDELWNLLDIIHRKGTRLRDEVEALQGMLREQSMEQEPCDFQRSLLHGSVDDVRQLRRERDILLDRVAEMEAETLAGRVHTSRLQSDLETLLAAKQDLEEQLRTVITQKSELNNRIHDMHMQFVSNKSCPNSPENSKPSSPSDCKTPPVPSSKRDSPVKRSPTRRSSVRSSTSAESLDSVLGIKIPRIKTPDSRRIAAILLEHDPIVLQKHLLSTSVQNQLLQQRLEMIIRTKNSLSEKLDKTKEENDDLRFQLEDRNIELEGTRARVRLLEQLQLNKPIDQSPDIIPVGLESNVVDHESRPPSRTEITTASMKAMSPLPLNLQMDHSSSTESAHDQTEQNRRNNTSCSGSESGRRTRPSKIPLPGVKSYAAPKPPVAGKQSPGSGARSRSGGSPSRSQSVQSWRNNKSEGNSLSGSKSQSSLTGGGGTKSRNGSLTAVRNGRDSLKMRDSLTGKLRSNDSLSKHRDSSVNNNSSFSASAGSTSKRDSSSSSSGGGGGKSGTAGRRMGSSSSSSGTSARAGRDSPDTKMYATSSINSSPWYPSLYNSDIDLCPDSLDAVQLPVQPHTISSSSHMFQTANMFFWNTSPTSEYFDSIDSASVNLNNCSMMDSSLYQPEGEGLAECDSLEKQLSMDGQKK